MEELTQIKSLVEDQNRVWNELKSEFAANRGASEEKENKLNARLDLLETKMSRTIAPAETQAAGTNDVKAAFLKYARTGDLSPEAKKALYVSNDTTGGYLALPGDFEASIIKNVIEMSPVRNFARVSSTSSGEPFKVPYRSSAAGAAVWTAEQGTRSATGDPAYGMLQIPAHELYAMADISVRNLEDSAFNLEQELNGEFTEQFGLAEGIACVTGSGVGKIEGIKTSLISSTNSSTCVVASGSAGDFDADDLIEMVYDVKDAYWNSLRWMMKRSTIKKIRKLKSATTNEYLWAPAVSGGFSSNTVASGVPATILDKPYFFADAMDATGTDNNYSLVIGDFSHFRLVDRLGTELQRDPFTQNTLGLVRFIARRRVGGQVTKAEAFRILKEH